MTNVIDEEWCVLASLLPQGWRELARETGAMTRARGEVTSPELLLQLLLLHVATGLSLRQSVARAKLQGLAVLSDVALFKRLRSSGGWLQELSRRMFESTRKEQVAGMVPEGRRLRAIDATTIEEPGATGTSWRVHYSLSLPQMACDFYDLSDVHGGESYKRVSVAPGDIILADRGYCQREGVAHVLQRGGDVIVRLNACFPMLEAEDDTEFQLLQHLRDIDSTEAFEWPVRFQAADGVWHARLCAVRRSEAAAELAKKGIS